MIFLSLWKNPLRIPLLAMCLLNPVLLLHLSVGSRTSVVLLLRSSGRGDLPGKGATIIERGTHERSHTLNIFDEIFAHALIHLL